jgi:hypothetical protein
VEDVWGDVSEEVPVRAPEVVGETEEGIIFEDAGALMGTGVGIGT